ncbi:MAG: GNAT family N-acetyltransferase [Bacteroidota bacterium]
MRLKANIRFVTTDDLPQIIELCEFHAQFEAAAYDGKGKQEELGRALFATTPKLYCLVAEIDGEIVAYATYMKQFATWTVKEYLYMDCLFVRDYARGLGIGKQLMRRIAKEGATLGCAQIQWQTPKFNERAIQFYHRLGATAKSKERFFLKL